MDHQQNQNDDTARRIAERTAQLARVGEALKAELFGIDDIIDRVLESVRAWYVLPDLITRPVIVCLWGLTGTGKTQLVRRLAQLLGFYDRFVEVQMDGFSHGSGYWQSSVSGMLADSGIEEGAAGIVLLDEFQRFRTITDKGADIKVERYQDVWGLLSDGRLPPPLSFMNDLEMAVAYSQYQGRDDDDEEEAVEAAPAASPAKKKARRFRLGPYEARELKQALKLGESLTEIMAWSFDELDRRLQAFRRDPARWGTDYSRLLVFITGNLDEMYRQVATRVEDCDTDADIFHFYTKRLSVVDVKKALGQRFRPEQVARLGNVHIVYPSLARATYERLIATICARLCAELQQACGLVLQVGDDVRAEVYANAVFPAQGTRPLFSSVHAMLGATLVDATLWALAQGAAQGDAVRVGLASDATRFVAQWGEATASFPVRLELNRLKQRSNADFRALLAVHEAGHALVYALLFGHAPLEVKINVASFDGGYNSFMPLRAESRQDVLDAICVGLAGRAAETLVFGANACTTGAQEDLRQATREAAEFVRCHGFAGRLSRTDVGRELDCVVNTDIEATNATVETLLASEFHRARSLLQEHAGRLAQMARMLVSDGEIASAELARLLGVRPPGEPAVLGRYAEQLEGFVAGLPKKLREVEVL